jgi:membrane-associated protease RseP (regulator of RpoE activity)
MNKPKLTIFLTICFVLLLAAFFIKYSISKIDRSAPRIHLTRSPSGIKNINVTVALPQIRREIVPIVLEDFLLQTKIDTVNDKGLKLTDFKDKSVLSKYGFERGDIVQEINGQKVQSMDEAIRICGVIEQELLKDRNAKEVNVLLDRGGEIVMMNFSIPQFIPPRVNYVMTLDKQINKKGRN